MLIFNILFLKDYYSDSNETESVHKSIPDVSEKYLLGEIH